MFLEKQLALDIPQLDENSIDGWVENCLRTRNDNAIIQAVSGMHKVGSQRVVDAINSQFSDFTEMVGHRRMRVRLISIPVSITSATQVAETAFSIDNITPYLQSFYQHGLIDRENGGIVLLNRLIDHIALESASLSDLYALSRAIFSSAKRGNDRSPNIGQFGAVSEDDASWLFVPDGYYTMRHMIGVVFWDESRTPPPIISGAGDLDAWQRSTITTLMMGALTREEGALEINILQPGRLFDSILQATLSMMERLATSLAIEAKEQSGEVTARITVGCDQKAPGRNQLRLAISPVTHPGQIIASATIRLSIMESIETATVMTRVAEALRVQNIVLEHTEYVTGPILEGGPAQALH